MLDIKWMRENRAALAAAMEKLNAGDAPWQEALALDEKRRQILSEVETLRAERNAGSKLVGKLFRDKKVDEANALKVRMSEIGGEIERLDGELRIVDAALSDSMLRIPNIPEPDVPVAPDEGGNVVVKEWGTKPQFDFAPLPHWELGEKLDIIDFARAVRMSGSRFYLLKGAGAQAAAGARRLVHRRARGRARLRGDLPAAHGALRGDGRHGQPAQVRRQPLPRRRGGLLVHPHGRGVGDQHLPRGDHRGGPAADLLRGVHALLPPGEDVRRQGRARHQAGAPVPEGGDGEVRRAAGRARRAARP